MIYSYITVVVLYNAVTTKLFLFLISLYFHSQDSISEVKFTDVDYRVFTDAARHIYQDGSPYDRHTYRYTPLLAWMLIPNINFTPLFGKFLFSAFDIIAAHLIYSYVRVSINNYCFILIISTIHIIFTTM